MQNGLTASGGLVPVTFLRVPIVTPPEALRLFLWTSRLDLEDEGAGDPGVFGRGDMSTLRGGSQLQGYMRQLEAGHAQSSG